MKKLVFQVLFICIFAHLHNLTFAQDRLQISLLTITPGAELNDVFGHSAIRVIDSNSVTDLVFNYGTFDFDDPNFYLKFIKGQLRYFVNAENYSDFVFYYQQVNRGTTEQILNLTDSEKITIKKVLLENIKEQNKYYQYDFFKDNCTTRIRDIFQKYHYPTPNLPAQMSTSFTYRNAIHQYLNAGKMYWGKFGIDILLGARTDAVMTSNEQMFLPDNLMKALDATNNTNIVLSKKQVYQYQKPTAPTTFFTPMACSVIMLLFYVLINLLKKQGNKFFSILSNVFDRLLFFIIGLLGILLIFMWWGTDHVMTKNNYNLIWASPLFILYALFLSKQINVVLLFSKIYAGLLLLLLCTWYWLPQQLNIALIPIVVLLVWRLFATGCYKRNNNSKY